MAGSLGPLMGMGADAVTVDAQAYITDFDPVSLTYTVLWNGVYIAYVYSLGDVKHDVGESVTIVVENGQVKGIIP